MPGKHVLSIQYKPAGDGISRQGDIVIRHLRNDRGKIYPVQVALATSIHPYIARHIESNLPVSEGNVFWCDNCHGWTWVRIV